MVFEFKESTRNFMSWVGGNAIIGSFIKNPFYTAILITIIIMLMIIFVFRNAEIESNESLTILALRTGIYSLLIITGIQFLQNQYVLNEVQNSGKETVLTTLFDTKDINKMMHDKVGGAKSLGADSDNSFMIAVPNAKIIGEGLSSGSTGNFNADFLK